MSEANTTELSYWLNWRFLLCALIVLFSMLFALFLIWRYEGGRKRSNGGQEHHCDKAGLVYEDEAWKTCTRWINPAWLLGFRVLSFILLLSLISGNAISDGGAIFCFYTQWTFTLVTVYFGLASGFSIYGVFLYKLDHRSMDTEKGMYIALLLQDDEAQFPQFAGFWGYLLQIIYQICSGAVVMTDFVFWVIIFPYLISVDYKMDCYMFIMHTVNVLLVGDTILNSLRFPVFRFGYFILWSATYVIFQWIIHACINFWWPYSFLDLSSSFAPLWYFGLAILHVPCYGLFVLLTRIKQWWLTKYMADLNQGTR